MLNSSFKETQQRNPYSGSKAKFCFPFMQYKLLSQRILKALKYRLFARAESQIQSIWLQLKLKIKVHTFSERTSYKDYHWKLFFQMFSHYFNRAIASVSHTLGTAVQVYRNLLVTTKLFSISALITYRHLLGTGANKWMGDNPYGLERTLQ